MDYHHPFRVTSHSSISWRVLSYSWDLDNIYTLTSDSLAVNVLSVNIVLHARLETRGDPFYLSNHSFVEGETLLCLDTRETYSREKKRQQQSLRNSSWGLTKGKWSKKYSILKRDSCSPSLSCQIWNMGQTSHALSRRKYCQSFLVSFLLQCLENILEDILEGSSERAVSQKRAAGDFCKLL